MGFFVFGLFSSGYKVVAVPLHEEFRRDRYRAVKTEYQGFSVNPCIFLDTGIYE